MTSEKDEEYFACLKVSPAQMDFLWAEGWRHFGIYFFRYQTSFHGDKKFSVMPLRIDLGRFSLTRSQKRVLAKNRDVRIIIRPAAVDPVKHELFNKHRVRFKDNIPTSLEDIVSPLPATVPCPSRELCVYLGERLVGATYLDLGQDATSACGQSRRYRSARFRPASFAANQRLRFAPFLLLLTNPHAAPARCTRTRHSSTLAAACASGSGKSRARRPAGARSCTCHKSASPTP